MIVRELLIKIGFRVDKKKVGDLDKGLTSLKAKASSATTATNGLGSSLKGVIGGLVGIGAAVQGGRFLVETISNFQKLRAQLVTIEQDEAKAERAFKGLQDFAQSTPFQLSNVVASYARLRAVGLQPTMDDMRAIGDVAAGMGKDIVDFSDAVVGATTGEMDRLKAFGIVGKTVGKQIEFSFKGVKTKVKKDAESISKFLFDLGRTQFAGGMKRQMNTIGGAWSNLQDNMAKFANQVGEAGLAKELGAFVRELTGAAGGADELALVLGRVLGFALKLLTDALKFAKDNSVLLLSSLSLLAAGGLIQGLLTLVVWAKAFSFAAAPLAIKIALIAGALLLVIAAVDDLIAFQQGRGSVIGGILGTDDATIGTVKAVLYGALAVLLIIFSVIAAIPAVILATIAAIVLLISHWDLVEEAFTNAFNALAREIQELPGEFANVFAKIEKFFTDMISSMWQDFSKFIDDVLNSLRVDVLNAIMDLPGIQTAIAGVNTAGELAGDAQAFFGDTFGGGAQDPSIDVSRRMNEVANSTSTNVTVPSVTNNITVQGAGDPEAVSANIGGQVESSLGRVLRDARSDAEGGRG